ncbi:9100_t:CDS:1, partial [Entrophospora sp. SA101]
NIEIVNITDLENRKQSSTPPLQSRLDDDLLSITFVTLDILLQVCI